MTHPAEILPASQSFLCCRVGLDASKDTFGAVESREMHACRENVPLPSL